MSNGPYPYGGIEDQVVIAAYVLQGQYLAEEDKIIYDYLNLIADVGGYLGLLLGYSILSISDGIIENLHSFKKLIP